MIMDISEINYSQLPIDEKKQFFINIQNYVSRNLFKPQRDEYHKIIQSIPDLNKKIDYVKSWVEEVELNIESNQILEWIDKYFPDEIEAINNQIKKWVILEDFIQILHYLRNRKEYYMDFKGDKIISDILAIRNKLKNELSKSIFESIEYELSEIESDEERLDFLLKEKKKRLG